MSFVKLEEDWLKLTNTAKLNYGEVILLCKIASLSNNKDKACTASNEYFASMLCTTDRNVKRYLKNLKEAEVIKTFEKKQGMKTTTRYIYPQFDKIEDYIDEYDEMYEDDTDDEEAGDENDTCSELAGDNFGKSRGQFVSEQVTDLVKAGDNSDTLIREEKRIKKNKRDNGANAPKVASLHSAIADKWTPKDDESKEIFGAKWHTDKKVMEIIRNEYMPTWMGKRKTAEDIANQDWVTWGNVNQSKVIEYITEVLMNEEN